MRYPHAHVNAHRTWYTPGAPPPPSISRAHVDYNYPQVITTHTTVFQWALTAVWPLYSAKLVFPFPVEENRTEIAKGRDRDGGRKKEETSGDRWLILDSASPTLTPFLPSVKPLRSPLTTVHHPRTCLFLQFARRPTIRFPGVVRLPYKCKAQKIRPRSGAAQTARKCVSGGMAAGTTYTCLV